MTAATPQNDPTAWFHDARFGMFIHWGIYAVLGHGEQPLFREFLNPSEYRTLADRFRAEKYDPADWAETARAAGMKYMVLTTKHHDGYCLWDTETTDFNAVKRGPGRDLVAEYASACREAGLRVGFYFSLPDWSHPACFAGPQNDPEGFRDFTRLIWRQIEELVTRYGQVDLLWFDGGRYPPPRHLRPTQLVKMMRHHQPGILINNRLGKPKKGGAWGYETPEQRLGEGDGGATWESCITAARKFWGYHVCHEDPSMWYSDRELMTFFVSCATRRGNLLWNVGPRANGELPGIYKERTRRLGEWIRRNAEAVYGTRPADFEFAYGGLMSQKGNRLYLFFLYWPGEEYSLPGFNEKLLGVHLVDGGQPVRAVQEPHRVVLKGMPREAPDICTVVALDFEAPPTAHPRAQCRLHRFPMPPMVEWLRL
ncbi:MAG: alpha-L-fucosidase [Armatimonadetes bacterium]|nr:alpha-L-fucosidase [Armatimonadota bacterium]